MPAKGNTLTRQCLHCGTAFSFQEWRAKPNRKVFCSVPCAARWNAAHRATVPAEERFWSRVDQSGDCWLWTGFIAPTGYGRFSPSHDGVGAHRYSWELHNGPIPDGLFVCHRCDVKPCVRPDHLFLGTSAENTGDRHGKARDARGERHGHAVLTEAAVLEIRARAAAGKSRMALAGEFGVARRSIARIIARQAWRHI